jgi:hypothetical protein
MKLLDFFDYLQRQRSEGLIIYPGPLRNYIINTEVNDLKLLVCEVDNKLYLTPEGKEEVDIYLEMVRKPVLRKSFSYYAKVISMLPVIDDVSRLKLVVDTWQVAEKEDILGAYFGHADYLRVCTSTLKDLSRYDLAFSDDYEDYVKSRYTLKEIAEKYLNYIESGVERPAGDLIYDCESLQMAVKSMSQRSEYTAVMDAHNDLVIPSDGLGVFSSMCILRDVKYVSWEPNPVGNKAVRLGIITSREPVYLTEPLYVFMYCVQYYALPFFPRQRFLVIDVITTRKPGFQRGLHCSSSHKDIKYDYLYPPDPMGLTSCYCLDTVTQSVTSAMGVPHRTAVEAQFILVANAGSLESSIHSGFFTKEYWTVRYNSMSKHEQSRFGSIDRLLLHIRQKTVLFFERSFPYRRGHMTAWRVENSVVKRDFGPGWYFTDHAMWYGHSYSPGDCRDDYQYDSGYFIFRDTVKPKNILYAILKPVLEEIYGTKHLKLFLVSSYRVSHSIYLTYVPEVKILKRSVLIDDV